MTPVPRLAAGLVATPDAAGRIVVRRPSGGLVRLTDAQWAALQAPDAGTTSEQLIASARAHGLLEDSAHAARPRSVEVSVAAPVRLLRRGAPVFRSAFGKAGLLAGVAIAMVGLVAAVTSGRLLGALLGPVSPLSLGGLALALACLTLLHELAHAAALTALGGQPGRLGLRLHPGRPTGFCEIGEVWLLPVGQQRTSVALAGIWTHAVIGGTALMVLAVASGLPETTTGTAVALFGVTALLAALGNAVPAGHTDGAVARALARDVPLTAGRGAGPQSDAPPGRNEC